MVWSNWQGAIWRGAMLVLLFGSGLAWTQTPAPSPTADPAERIMVVHDHGKSTRCRVMETWQLPDRRVAHLLQAIETGEMITIVDEQGAVPDTVKNSPAMSKRIFAWGTGRRTPPDGSPIPPHLRMDSGIVIKNEIPPPIDAVPTPGPVVFNRAVDEKALGGSFTIRNEGPFTVVENGPTAKTGLLNRLFPKQENVMANPGGPQVVDFRNSTPIVQGPSPMIVNEAPVAPVVNQATALTGGGPGPLKIDMPPPPQPIQSIAPNPMAPTTSTPSINANVAPYVPPANVAPPAPSGSLRNFEANKNEPSQSVEPAPKKRWYPGANIQAWLHGKPAPNTPTTEIVKTESAKKEVSKTDAAKTEAAKTDEAKKLQKAEDFLEQQNKVAYKQLTEKLEKMYGAPFTTARMPLPDAPQPEMKKSDPSPLVIPNKTFNDDKPIVPAPKDETVKPINFPGMEKRDMWGNGGLTPIPPPGKSLLDPAMLRPEPSKLPPPPTARPNDPLLSPEKLVPNDDRLKPKAGVLPPVARPVTETSLLPDPADVRSNPYPARPANWPLGTQSVQAANSGLLGTPMYIPVPTVTVPQPHNPPVPPAPKLPDAPNLNAYVNAFTPPPPPKTAPQQQPMQGMMQPQAMAPYGNPMMTQQQMLQQQALAQQQMMMQYGYRPNPAMMNAYMPQQPMATQGPLANFSRQYVGPQAPNPFAANPGVQTGYAPAPYSPMMPIQAMMPQQQVMQPVAYQQQPVPTQQQAITQQVEQLIKVMRESPYPAQREWAAQSLTSFEWRVHPQIVPALIQSASQDPAASVRAGCVYCLGRMQAAVEPVFGTLHAMRNDIDPRVRSEVEQAFVRLGQTPMAPQ